MTVLIDNENGGNEYLSVKNTQSHTSKYRTDIV
jgi:hypothetical protein